MVWDTPKILPPYWWLLFFCQYTFIVTVILPQWNLQVQAQSIFPGTQLNALRDLYISTNGNKWVWNDPADPSSVPWNFTTPYPNPCIDNWQGVSCNQACESALPGTNCEVWELDLHSHHLNGSLSDSLANITSLRLLNLADNFITGNIPLSWRMLMNLTSLDMSGNSELGGTIPNIFQQWTNLITLDLSHAAFQGSFPSSLYQITALEYLDMSVNSLNGTIGNDLCNIIGLQYLYLNTNNFGGSLPSCIGNLKHLNELVLSSNHLTSTIPLSIAMLTSLQTLDLSENLMFNEIPDNISNLLNLTVFSIQNNLFDGQIPQSIYKLNNLNILTINNNFFTGNIPNISTSIALSIYSVEYNFLFGKIEQLNMSNMLLLTTDHNYLSGQLPPMINQSRTVISDDEIDTITRIASIVSHQELQEAIVFVTENTNFTGNLFFYTNMSSNYFTGTIPIWVVTSPILTYVYMFDNLLTGTIPEVGPTVYNVSRSLLGILYLDNNILTGTIPHSIINQRRLNNIRLASNQLTGTIPSELFYNNRDIVAVEVESNRFTGSLPGITDITLPKLRILSFGDNHLTGKLYDNYTSMPQLAVFAINTNCFSGTIPNTLCDAPLLSEVILDGLSASAQCRQQIFPFIPSFTSFELKHGIDGTIPSCLYEMPVITSLYLSGNILGGTIPSNVNLSDSLINLRLSYNSLTGTIPSIIQKKSWHILDLSYNRLSGHLDSELFDDTSSWKNANDDDAVINLESVKQKQALYLDVNRLSGNIPSGVRELDSVSILNQNLFECSLNRQQLPKEDPKYQTYSCASDALYQALLAWLLFIMFLGIVLLVLKHQVGNIYKHVYLPLRATMKEWHRTFELSDHLLADIINQSNIQQIDVDKLTHVFSIAIRYFHMLRMFSLGISLMSLIVFMPLYRILNIYQSVYENKYSWEYSAIYMGGIPAGIILFIVFCAMLLSAFIRYHKRFQALIVETYVKNGGDKTARHWEISRHGVKITRKDTIISDVSTLSMTNSVFRSTTLGVSTVIRETGYSDNSSPSEFNTAPYTISRASDPSKSSLFISLRSSHWSWTNCCIVGGIDFVCMTFVNIVYVGIQVYVNERSVTTLAQIVLALFKVWWNEVFIWVLVKSVKSGVAECKQRLPVWKDTIKKGFHRHTMTNIDQPPVDSVVTNPRLHDRPAATPPGQTNNAPEKPDPSKLNASDIFLIVCCLLYNNIIAPSISVSIVSPACFFNAFYAAGSITSTYVYCASDVHANAPSGVKCTEAAVSTTTFSPPFIYSYSCSSRLPENYVTVYLYMLLLSGFVIPVSNVIMKYLYDHYLDKEGVWRVRLGNILPISLAALYAEPDDLPQRFRTKNKVMTRENGNSSNLALSNVKPIFDKHRFVVRCIGFLTLLVSFGVVYPPLGFVAALAVVFITIYEETNIGRILFEAESAGYAWYFLKIAHDFEGIAESFVTAVLPMGMVACLLFSSLIFDTFGNARGAKVALIPAVITLFLPLAIWTFIETNWQHVLEKVCGKRNEKNNETNIEDDFEMRKSNATSLGGKNPLHNGENGDETCKPID